MCIEDFGKVWADAVPEPFKYDVRRMERVRDLCKFMKLTYAIYNVEDIEYYIIKHNTGCYNKNNRHSKQKMVKLRFGV